MKLNIINFNQNIKNDEETINDINILLDKIKKNISKENYIPYQNMLNKLAKFINMFEPKFIKDIENNTDDNFFVNNSDDDLDDNVSISSISEYSLNDDEIDLDEIDLDEINLDEIILKMNSDDINSNEKLYYKYIYDFKIIKEYKKNIRIKYNELIQERNKYNYVNNSQISI
jgi:hypothetical protein